MINKEKIEELAAERSMPCVSISLNTHRTFPDSAQDEIVLKNLLKEAESRLITDFGKKSANGLLEKIANISSQIDHNYNLDSLHIFISNNKMEILKSVLPVNKNKVCISESFALRTIINDYIRRKKYLILLLSQGSTHLYKAFNESITEEVLNDDFPFPEMERNINAPEKLSDARLLDDIVREHLNKIDKAVVKISNQTDLECVVICTEDNLSRLMQVANKPKMYIGHAFVNYNDTSITHLAKQSWEVINELQKKNRTEAINEMLDAVSQAKVLSDLQEIYLAALNGQGELLIVHENFIQPVLMNGDRTFDLISDTALPNAIEDITSNIVWEVFSKKGRVVFTAQEKIKELGKIVLKTRY